MLERCWQHQISLNLNKCIFCAPFGILLGHIVCKKCMLVDLAKIAIIVDLPTPTTVKQLRETLGHTRYCHNFIRGYAMITASMEKFIKEICEVQVERREPEEPRYAKAKDGRGTNISFFGLDKGVPCPCQCFVNHIRSNIGPTRRSINWPPDFICKSEVVYCGEKLHDDIKRRIGDGVYITKNTPLHFRREFQNVYKSLNIEVLGQ